jgi:hypothetical protein
MTTEKLNERLKSIGKAFFVKWYYQLKNGNYSEISEDYADKSMKTRKSNSKQIFDNNLQVEALEIIINSSQVDSDTIKSAEKILKDEKK